MISHKAVGSMTLVIIAVAGIRAFAEDQTAADLYGQGVHAYFANNYDSAIVLLSAAIEKNGADPRTHFFRGLAMASRHGMDSGLADFAKGAELEIYRKDDRLYDVNSALQRVQGSLRMAVENQRTAARLAAAEKKKKQDRIKYEELKRREDIVLFQPNRPVKKIDLKLPEVEMVGQNPFATGVAFTGGKEVQAATPIDPVIDSVPEDAEEMGDQRDPFAGPAKVAPAPKQPNPFGDITPEAPPKTERAPADGGTNPFGDITPEAPPKTERAPAGDGTNPFGDDMNDVAPDDPIFDENIRPELPPGMNVGGTIMDLLGKTLSGEANESSDRDPFGEDEPVAPPKSEPAADEGAKPDKKPDPNINPFD